VNNYAHIVILAGENSGDQIAADLIIRLKSEHANVSFSGVGGQKMAEQGVNLLADYRNIAIMGFGDIVKKVLQLLQLKRSLKKHFQSKKPNLLICVDYPGFNLSMASTAKKCGIPVLYYVCPKIWASRKKRSVRIKRDVDELIAILPFEEIFFNALDIPVTYVGHPLMSHIKKEKPNYPIQKVLLMPGSRDSEIKRLAPLMCEVGLMLHAQYGVTFAMPMANNNQRSLLHEAFAPLIEQEIAACFEGSDGYAQADYAIVASGTATLELAKRGIPMQVVYRLDRLSYWIARRIVTVQSFSLCNLIAGKTIVPELIQTDATPENVCAIVSEHFQHPEQLEKMKNDLAAVIASLGDFKQTLLIEKVLQFLPFPL